MKLTVDEYDRSGSRIWFAEPQTEDPTWAEDGESTVSWLKRSTVNRAVLARSFLNINLNELPLDLARHSAGRLTHHWESTFFELIVARTLQELGASLEWELETTSGRRPDFSAVFGKSRVVVEAVAPVVSKDHNEYRAVVPQLKRAVASVVPSHLSLLLHDLPRLSPRESKKGLKRKVADLLSSVKEVIDEPLELEDFDGQLLTFSVYNRHEDWRPIMGGPGLVYLRDSVTPLRKTFKRKRAQLRDADGLRVIAISGANECDIDDLDRALFGMTLSTISGKLEFLPNGEFLRSRSSEPTVSGVLFYKSSTFFCRHEPILFVNPRINIEEFPVQLRHLEHRLLIDSGTVTRVESAEKGLMSRLRPVPSDQRIEADG